MNQMTLLNSDSSYTSHRLKKAIHEIKVPITIGNASVLLQPFLCSHPCTLFLWVRIVTVTWTLPSKFERDSQSFPMATRNRVCKTSSSSMPLFKWLTFTALLLFSEAFKHVMLLLGGMKRRERWEKKKIFTHIGIAHLSLDARKYF